MPEAGIKRFFSPVPRPNAANRNDTPSTRLPDSASSPDRPVNQKEESPFKSSSAKRSDESPGNLLSKRICRDGVASSSFKQASKMVIQDDNRENEHRNSSAKAPRIYEDEDDEEDIVHFRATPAKAPRIEDSDDDDDGPTAPKSPIFKMKVPTYATPKSTPVATVSKSLSIPSVAKDRHQIDVVPSDDVINHPHLEYSFLYPPHRRDINQHKPDHPDYDEKTLYVPERFLDSQTPALRQWWLIKQRNMDAILFFKMGKFYELFNEDAVIGVKNLEIAYMKGDESKPAHAGFPEVSYDKYSKILIDRGYKVMRIEQTETPAMMEDRCKRTGRKGKFDKVVAREVCRVTTKGTQMLSIMESVFHSPQAQYLLAICECNQSYPDDQNSGMVKSHVTGVCFVDVTIGKMHIGQFFDDYNQSKLNILIAHHRPTEVLYERNNLSKSTYQALLKTGALLTALKPTKEFWPIKRALTHLRSNYIIGSEQNGSNSMEFLKDLFQNGDDSENLLSLEPKDEFKMALSSFGAIVYYLQSHMIDGQVLSCSSFELYLTPLERSPPRGPTDLEGARPSPPMILDHIVLRNLEIFENSSGGTHATLYESINLCKTHFGQRLLKNWICAPLCDIKQLNNRLDAVQAFINNNNASLLNECSHILNNTPDLERLLSKIKSQCFKSGNDTKAIMFDGNQHSKVKINSFLNLLSNFKRLLKFIKSVCSTVSRCESQVLKRLLTLTSEGGLFPDYSSALNYFDSAFNHEHAKKTGQIIPEPGVDSDYDECKAGIEEIQCKLNDYLDEQKKVLRCRQIEYFGSAKNRFQIQVPDGYCKNIPDEYRIETTRKGYKRFYTPTIDKLFQKLTIYEENLKKILDGIMSKTFEEFVRKINLWSAAIECIAILDVLQSIASFVRSLKANNVDVCRPEFIEPRERSGPVIDYKNGRHPALVKFDPNYIANDLVLDEKLILLSGANMGGKSTLMRQTALLTILSQVGSFVPASKMVLTPVDRIFSRLGASDRLIEGESTFYTELVETSAMLNCATSESLLLLDELGRGTSTHDGTAIAFATIEEISTNIKCRCLFSTHYHSLVKDFETSNNVRLAHMSCQVDKMSASSDDSVDLDPLKENITFLYKIAEGPVGRSYGFNVAKLAGISDEIISEAFRKAKDFEQRLKKTPSAKTGLNRS